MTVTQVRLRTMLPADLDTIEPLEQELFAGDPPWSRAQFESELVGVPETRWYVVAERSSDLSGLTTGAPHVGDLSGLTSEKAARTMLVGYAGLRAPAMAGEPADIQTIGVAPDAQRQGVGSVLMDALIAEASAREAGSIMLEVRADNQPALAFYARYGFECIATRRRYYADGRDGLVMRKRLRRLSHLSAAEAG